MHYSGSKNTLLGIKHCTFPKENQRNQNQRTLKNYLTSFNVIRETTETVGITKYRGVV